MVMYRNSECEWRMTGWIDCDPVAAAYFGEYVQVIGSVVFITAD